MKKVRKQLLSDFSSSGGQTRKWRPPLADNEPNEFPDQGGNKKESTRESRPSKYINQFNIFPNPTDALVSVEWNASEIATTAELQISVVDIQGRQWMNIKEVNVSLQRKAINLSHLNNGAYIIKIMDAEGRLLRYENIILEK